MQLLGQYRYRGLFDHIRSEHTENIVDRGEWLGSPVNIKGVNKDAKI